MPANYYPGGEIEHMREKMYREMERYKRELQHQMIGPQQLSSGQWLDMQSAVKQASNAPVPPRAPAVKHLNPKLLLTTKG